MQSHPRPHQSSRGQATALLPRYPHRAVRALSTVAHRLAVGFLMILITAALLAALYDIGQQLIKSDRASKVSDVIITFGTYVVIVRLCRSVLVAGASLTARSATTGHQDRKSVV